MYLSSAMPAQRSNAGSSRAAKRSRTDREPGATSTRQKTRPAATRAEKDDNELELESFLFGRKRARIPTASTSKQAGGTRRFELNASDAGSDGEDLQEMADDELFHFDGAGPSTTRADDESQLGEVPDDQVS